MFDSTATNFPTLQEVEFEFLFSILSLHSDLGYILNPYTEELMSDERTRI